MNKTIRWLHLSDFHTGKYNYEQKFSADRFIEHINTKKINGIEPDFLFITGDIANTGKPDEFKTFADNIIYPIIELYGSDFVNKIFIVPGNHDLDRDVNEGFSKDKFSATDSPFFHPTKQSLDKRKMLVERFDAFRKNIPIESFVDIFSEAGAACTETYVRDSLVGIIGLNTAWLCDGLKDKEALTPGIALLRDALKTIEKSNIRFVLGHHPLDWFHPLHRPAIQAVLAANQVIYLHGHMHIGAFTTSLHGSGEFLAIQAGAAWQSPEGGKWRNGFMWGEFDVDNRTVSLQPFSWNFDDQCWALDSSRFHENHRQQDKWVTDAPRTRNTPNYTPKIKPKALIGWEVRDLTSLERYTGKLDEKESICYFDGSVPTWAIALSSSIPRREIVYKLAGNFRQDSSIPQVCVLLGAGCEGKSTALLQASLEILRSDNGKRILSRTNHTCEFNIQELRRTIDSHDNWLIVIDEADQVAKEVLRFIDSGFNDFQGKIDFLLASRDSDWQSSGAKSLAWAFRAKYKEETLKDLSLKDAELIVDAWAQFGNRGLGEELSILEPSKRADKLRFHAKKEAKGGSGAFFGALLVSRHGNDLLQHAELMLERLNNVHLTCNKSLKDVLGYIAAMHVEGFDKLSFATLAGILDMKISKLQSDVLRQLGKEAAATSTSTSIFTRHKYIAKALLEVLETKFNEDISHYYIDLATAEVTRAKTEEVIDLAFWRYDMAEQLFKAGKTRLAIDVAKSVHEAEPSNFNVVTKLASLYRRQGNAPEAISLFRNFYSPPRHRGFYFEWGVCEGIERNRVENALLATFALSDESENQSLTVENIQMYLHGLSNCCDQLHIAYADTTFIDAEAACNSIMVILSKQVKSKNSTYNNLLLSFTKDVEKKRKKLYERADAIKTIKAMALNLEKYGSSPQVTRVVDVKNLSFTSLDQIVRNVEGIKISTR